MTQPSPAGGTRAGSAPVAVIRIVAALAVLSAVTATFLDTATRSPIDPFNFFGFFTIQGNILLAVVLLIAALRRRRESSGLVLVRGAATSYIVVVGLVYNTLLTGLAGGVALPWANTVMHLLFPIYGLLDWLLVADRPPLPWRRLWLVLVYPLVWLIVVLVRGATDGWVPYPFLDPANGYGSVAVYVVIVAVAFLLSGALVWALSRVRLLGRR